MGPSPAESKPSFWKLPEALPIWEAGSKRKLSPSAEDTVTGEEDGLMKERGSSLLLAIHSQRGEVGKASFFFVTSTDTGTREDGTTATSRCTVFLFATWHAGHVDLLWIFVLLFLASFHLVPCLQVISLFYFLIQ